MDQLEKKLQNFKKAELVQVPAKGWLHVIRNTMGISLQQVANRMNVTRQSVQAIERREQEGSITLKNLQAAADALDMKLVYGFVPKDGSIEGLIERKSKAMAKEIVTKVSHTMMLEDQGVSQERLQKAVEERAAVIKSEMPKALWDYD